MGSGRPLADHPDEPHRPDAVLRRLHGLGAESWPDRADLIAIDGKTSRRSHDRSADKAALHLVSAFATTSRLVIGQEAVAAGANEITTIPALIERLAANDGLK